MNAISVMIKTVFVKKKRIKINFILIPILLFSSLIFTSCSKDDEPKEEPMRMRLIDDWRFTYRRSFVLMSLKANGNWESQVREEGKFSKIVEKKGKQRGKWELVDDKYVKIIVETGDNLDINWEPGNTYQYLVSTLTEDIMVLIKEDSGREYEWKRMRAKKSASPQGEGGTEITSITIPMPPIIVNLSKRSPYSKERYICVNFEFVKELEVPVKNPENLPPINPVHPELRENIMLYLSSLKYKEINTFDEVKVVKKDIQKMISPYFKGRLKEFKLENIIVAGSRGSFEEFIIQYPDQMVRFGLKPPEAPQKEEGEAKEEEKES